MHKLTDTDLGYLLRLATAENDLEEESQHLPGQMPDGLLKRICYADSDALVGALQECVEYGALTWGHDLDNEPNCYRAARDALEAAGVES